MLSFFTQYSYSSLARLNYEKEHHAICGFFEMNWVGRYLIRKKKVFHWETSYEKYPRTQIDENLQFTKRQRPTYSFNQICCQRWHWYSSLKMNHYYSVEVLAHICNLRLIVKCGANSRFFRVIYESLKKLWVLSR